MIFFFCKELKSTQFFFFRGGGGGGGGGEGEGEGGRGGVSMARVSEFFLQIIQIKKKQKKNKYHHPSPCSY